MRAVAAAEAAARVVAVVAVAVTFNYQFRSVRQLYTSRLADWLIIHT